MKKYIIVPADKLEWVRFDQVLETSPGTLRYSLDGKFFILKYTEDQPEFCYNITQDLIGLEEYTHEEITEILKTPEWTSQD
tara:strand:- start:221 stop:463 length:243 start_codon:yes stop_codon:yes gene_type:complete